METTSCDLILETGIINTQLFSAEYSNTNTGSAVSALFREMGSPRAFLIEYVFAAHWADRYTRQNQSKGVDLISRTGGRNLEVKASNASGGVDLQPSGGKGMNRTPKTDEFFANCETCDYVVADSTHMKTTGNLRFVILSGAALREMGKHKFTKRELDRLFAQTKTPPL